ncbi:MAG: DUF1810 domain-containing protein [Desulfovibrio sp.]|nr:DUF1810 domain-containing protein [Desulfovibrio sp.]
MYDMSRFLKAQQADYQAALQEIRMGKKQGHWMWYIFPQLKGLGRSRMAEDYAIADLQEAKAYLENPVLASRIRELANALLALPTSDPVLVFGRIDALKLRSSMTLFDLASEEEPSLFKKVIEKFYNSQADQKTLELLDKQKSDNKG